MWFPGRPVPVLGAAAGVVPNLVASRAVHCQYTDLRSAPPDGPTFHEQAQVAEVVAEYSGFAMCTSGPMDSALFVPMVVG